MHAYYTSHVLINFLAVGSALLFSFFFWWKGEGVRVIERLRGEEEGEIGVREGEGEVERRGGGRDWSKRGGERCMFPSPMSFLPDLEPPMDAQAVPTAEGE